jgi:hypothetical protein
MDRIFRSVIRRTGATALLAASLLVGCAQPLPAARADYAGEWRGKGVALLITADGMVVYERKADGSSVSLNAPIKRFDGDDFEVGIGPMVTRFDVTEPPAEVDGEWRMTVDGRVLTRVDGSAAASAPDGELISA